MEKYALFLEHNDRIEIRVYDDKNIFEHQKSTKNKINSFVFSSENTMSDIAREFSKQCPGKIEGRISPKNGYCSLFYRKNIEDIILKYFIRYISG